MTRFPGVVDLRISIFILCFRFITFIMLHAVYCFARRRWAVQHSCQSRYSKVEFDYNQGSKIFKLYSNKFAVLRHTWGSDLTTSIMRPLNWLVHTKLSRVVNSKKTSRKLALELEYFHFPAVLATPRVGVGIHAHGFVGISAGFVSSMLVTGTNITRY